MVKWTGYRAMYMKLWKSLPVVVIVVCKCVCRGPTLDWTQTNSTEPPKAPNAGWVNNGPKEAIVKLYSVRKIANFLIHFMARFYLRKGTVNVCRSFGTK